MTLSLLFIIVFGTGLVVAVLTTLWIFVSNVRYWIGEIGREAR